MIAPRDPRELSKRQLAKLVRTIQRRLFHDGRRGWNRDKTIEYADEVHAVAVLLCDLDLVPRETDE